MADALNFRLRIGVENDTGKGLSSVVSSITRSLGGLTGRALSAPFRAGKAGLGILRDINLGLAPVVRGIDNIIDRGTKLEVIRKTFGSLTGESGRRMDKLAAQIVRASGGTLRMADAMSLANRALGSMSFDTLTTAVEFISKKSVATGKDAGEALNTVITGLVRGSTLFLDDFGILVDGVDGVKRSFDAIKGSGAFDALSPAAQKAETIRQAIGEMRGQMRQIGVSGKETFFLWSGIKNAIGDGVDKMVLTIAKSDALKASLMSVRDIIGGITAHFQGGGSIGDLLFGKKGGAGGGVFGILKAGLLDVGEALGRGILGGLLKGLSLIPDLFESLWSGAKSFIGLIGPAIKDGLSWLKTELLPAWEKTIKPLTDAIGGFIDNFISALNTWLETFTHTPQGDLTTIGKWLGFSPKPTFTLMQRESGPESIVRELGLGHSIIPHRNTLEADQEAAKARAEAFGASMKGANWVEAGIRGIKFSLESTITGLTTAIGALFSGDWWRLRDSGKRRSIDEMKLGASSAGVRGATTMAGSLAQLLVGTTLAQIGGGGLWDLLRASGNRLLSGGVLGGDTRIKGALSAFQQDFPSPNIGGRLQPRVPEGLELSARARDGMWRRLSLIEGERKLVEQGNRGVHEEARRRSIAEIEEARRRGFQVRPEDRRRIFARNEREVREERERALKDEERQIRDQLDRDKRVRDARVRQRENWRKPLGGDAAAANQDPTGAALVASGSQQVDLLTKLIDVGMQIASALGEGDQRLAAIGPQRA